MNVHHLELFYYVAKHGGISQAVRNIPYGIQQPAISAQILQLEENLGVTLFHRRPFQLTKSGKELFEFIEPFFGKIDEVAKSIRNERVQHLKLVARDTIMRIHVPEILRSVRRNFPGIRVTLKDARQAELERMLQNQEVDFGVVVQEDRPSSGMKCLKLVELPLLLLVHKDSLIEKADQLWKLDKIEETLISLPADEMLYKLFQQELKSRRIDWLVNIELATFDLIETYVANKFGIGLAVKVPGKKLRTDVRIVELPGFPRLTISAFWRGHLTPVAECFLKELRQVAEED